MGRLPWLPGMLSAESVKQHAREVGFDLCGIARAEALPELARIHEWMAKGYAGDMAYLPRTAGRREDIRRVLSSARSVIVTGTLYNTDRPYSVEISDPGQALVSRYAWGDDYHEVVGRRLTSLLDWMRREQETPFDAVAYVDTGPVHERAWAQRAGLGWIGKNGCVINPAAGSWLFLSVIACSLPFQPDAPAFDQCGTCTLCLEACPTGALVAPQVLDARRCISYLTIELRRAIPEALRAGIGTHVYGCDICQDVCPWNQAVPRSADPAWQPREELDHPRLIDLWRRSDEGLERLVHGSAMTRAKTTGLRRNLAVALGNSAQPGAGQALAGGQGEARAASVGEAMVQEHVRWALDQVHAQRTSEPASPKAEGREPASPKAEGREPASPKAEGREPASPKPEGREPASPKPEGREPASPKPGGREPASPKPGGRRRVE